MTDERRAWQREADLLANRSLDAGDPTSWFETLYAAAEAGQVTMPWDRDHPHPLLAGWTSARDHAPGRAVVVGCGLGADAEHLAGLGYRTTAFDLSETAVRTAVNRHPGTRVDYRVADLFALPAPWRRAFDLVVDVYTVQALPVTLRRDTVAAIAGLVAPAGTLLTVQAVRGREDAGDGPPWPLTRQEIGSFTGAGLTAVAVEELGDAGSPTWRAEFRRGPAPRP